MMKRGYVWSGIIGALLVVLYAFNAVTIQPTHMQAVNVALYGQDALLVALGIFLVVLYLLGRQAQDAGHVPEKLEPDSPEDTRALQRKQNLVFAFFILYEFIFSFQSWVLNNYAAGPTLINIEMIFDLGWNIVMFFLIIGLFLDKRSLVRPFAYIVVAGSLIEAVISVMRADWPGAISSVLLAAFFVYAIARPLNRIRFRIINLILLPALIICSGIAVVVGNIPLNHLNQNESLLWQEYQQDISNVGTAYGVFLQQNNPTSIDIANVQTTAEQMDKDAPGVVSAFQALQTAYSKQLPSVSQQENLKELQIALMSENLDEQEARLAEQLMNYSQGLNFNDLTAAQKSQIASMEQQMDTLSQEINKTNYQSNNL